jgi:hypothetical protein
MRNVLDDTQPEHLAARSARSSGLPHLAISPAAGMLTSGFRDLLMPLNLIEPRRLDQAVADQIAELIRAEEYGPGDRLRTNANWCGNSASAAR